MQKVVLITGTSSGLGLEAAIVFAKNGYKVYATMRDTSKSDKLTETAGKENVTVAVLSLDVADTTSVQQCVDHIIKTEGRIDVLINNAGSGFAKTTEQASEEELHWLTNVNYFGVVRCTKAVLPYMRAQKNGHVINISSVGGLVGQPFNELYCATKFAVEGFTESLATYLTDAFGIRFSIVEPGGISSEFMTTALKNTTQDGKMTLDAYQPILDKYLSGMRKRAGEGTSPSFQSSREVAEVVFNVAQKENPPLRVRTSMWAENFCRYKTESDPDGTKLVQEIKEKFLG